MRIRGALLGMIHRLTIGSLFLGGCAYQADTFSYAHEPFKGWYVTVDCLDLAIEHRKYKQANRDIISYQFGNRCDDPTTVDLAAARVYGRTDTGDSVALVPYDPKQEIRVMQLDGRSVGREAIEYPTGRQVHSLCVDAASIAQARPARWVCFNE
jgi:hypothetical protein